jgi:hypothetical protein
MSTGAYTKNIVSKEKAIATPPTAALILPFDPKMTPKHDLELTLRRNLETAEKKLLTTHAAEDAMPVIKRLQQALRGLNFSTHKRSVAIFVTAETARTTYMEFAVEERLIIDKPFRTRDLADCKPGGKECLLLLLSARESKMYLKTGETLRLIKSNSPQNVFAYVNERPEQTANFSDREDRQEIVLNKFLHHMDVGLDAVLKAYPLPVFVAGVERVTGHFSRITQHQEAIAGYVNKHGMDATPDELELLFQPLLDNWQTLRQRLLLLQMEKAAGASKLVCGIDAVSKAAACSNARLVIVGTMPTTGDGADKMTFYSDASIDQAVEKVLQSGGDVEKLDRSMMEAYGGIALIRYY